MVSGLSTFNLGLRLCKYKPPLVVVSDETEKSLAFGKLNFQPRLNSSQVLVLSACISEIFKKIVASREDKNPKITLQFLDFVPMGGPVFVPGG